MVAFAHFAFAWGQYVMLAWLPTYLVQSMSIALLHNDFPYTICMRIVLSSYFVEALELPESQLAVAAVPWVSTQPATRPLSSQLTVIDTLT